MPEIRDRQSPLSLVDDPRVFNALIAILSLTAFGTLGYRLIEGYSWLDSLYMTVITLSTVGYREMAPLTTTGKIFTLVLIVVGIGMVLTIVGMWAGMLLEGEFHRYFNRRRVARTISKMRNHYIICGYGDFGRRVAAELLDRGTPLVIVDREGATADGAASVQGDATHDEVLLEAGVEHAQAVLCTMSSEAANLAIALAAKDLNPDVSVVARAETEATAKRLIRAGATRTVAPYAVAGHRMALAALHPRMIDLGGLVRIADQPRISIVELTIAAGSSCDGVTLEQADLAGRFDVTVLGVLESDGDIRLNPVGSQPLEAGEILLVAGAPLALEKLAGELGD